ncbi:hypothetical protein [Rickettsia endosymbiont of Nabis limbatus]|uniref:hypothetical protein n=1 Tax=Rickettsia endosymbiont of Nabis limbatus TaxID=3066268 RepID=UPI003AF34089
MYSLYNKNSIINIPVTHCLSAIQRLFEYETRVILLSKIIFQRPHYAQYLPFDLTRAQKATKEIFDTIPVQKQAINEAISNLEMQNVDPKFTNLNFEDQELGDFSKYLDVRKEKLALISSIEHPNPKWKESGAWTEALENPTTYAQKFPKSHSNEVTQQAQNTGEKVKNTQNNENTVDKKPTSFVESLKIKRETDPGIHQR